MSNTTVPISEWCKEIRVALARKEMNLQSVADEIGYSYTTITALISGRIVKDNYLDIAKKINEVLEVNVLPEKPQGKYLWKNVFLMSECLSEICYHRCLRMCIWTHWISSARGNCKFIVMSDTWMM